MFFVLSGFIGSLAAVMMYLNGILATAVGSMRSNLIVHISGLALSALVLALTRSWRHLPKGFSPLWLSGGAIGYLTVLLANFSFASLGVSMTIGLGLLGQVLASVATDHFGLFGSSVRKFRPSDAVGLAAIFAGILAMSFA